MDGRLTAAHPAILWLAAGAVSLGLLFPSRWLLFTVYAYLLLLLAAYLWARTIGPRLKLTRRLATSWAEVGDELEERWSVANGSPLPLNWLALNDASTLPGYNTRRVVACAAGQVEQWQTVARCERRGVFQLGPLTAELRDPFGLFRFRWREPGVKQLVVYPPLVRLPPAPFPRGQRGGLARADLLQLYATPSVGGVREYAPGDPPGRVHWPLVARHGRLMVKEFDQERAGALWLVLDLHSAAYPPVELAPDATPAAEGHTRSSVLSARPTESRPATLVDLAVTLTASLAARALAEGRAVGLLCDDGRRRVVPPGSGPRQLWQIMGELADGAATGGLSLGELLRQGLGPRGGDLAGGALVVVTGALDGAWVPALAAAGGRMGRALAVLVSADAAAAARCEALLGGHAVPAQSFVLGTPLPLLNPPRQRVTARVTPMGRVIRTN